MEYILRHFHNAGVFSWLYAASLFFGFHFFGVHYIHSSFLERHLSQSDVGLIYAIGSLLTLLILGVTSLILNRVGNYNTALIATALNFGAIVGLATTGNVGWMFVFFGIHIMLAPVTLFAFDVFLEANTTDENTTGSTRGIFLSMGLIAALFAPAISGYLAGSEASYEYAYLASALYLLPVFVILNMRFRDFKDPIYEVLSPILMFRAVWNNKNVLHISVAQFLMRFFFSWYVVYLPIYLHQQVGFSWPEIGVILFIMLVPYVFIEYPAGRLADRVLGEKELLVTGFIIAGLGTAALFFIDTPNLLLWSAVLFVTRIGAALIESMTETYFFKQIDGDDTSIISVFRMVRPLAYVIGPLSAGALLVFTDLKYLWLILAIIMMVGIIHPLNIKDTK